MCLMVGMYQLTIWCYRGINVHLCDSGVVLTLKRPVLIEIHSDMFHMKWGDVWDLLQNNPVCGVREWGVEVTWGWRWPGGCRGWVMGTCRLAAFLSLLLHRFGNVHFPKRLNERRKRRRRDRRRSSRRKPPLRASPTLLAVLLLGSSRSLWWRRMCRELRASIPGSLGKTSRRRTCTLTSQDVRTMQSAWT